VTQKAKFDFEMIRFYYQLFILSNNLIPYYQTHWVSLDWLTILQLIKKLSDSFYVLNVTARKDVSPYYFASNHVFVATGNSYL